MILPVRTSSPVQMTSICIYNIPRVGSTRREQEKAAEHLPLDLTCGPKSTQSCPSSIDGRAGLGPAEAHQGIVIGRVPLPLKLQNRRCETLDARRETSLGFEAPVSVGQGRLLYLLA